MKKKVKLPFRMLPASWGLKGKSREIAEAEYYYEGLDLERRLAEINSESEEDAEVAKLEVDLRNEVISKAEFDKKVAGIRNEPYVNVLNMGIDPQNVVQGYFELDWNDEFIKMLQSAGLTGKNDEEIVNKWFNGVCRTVLLQEKADLDYGLQESNDDVIRRAPQEPDGA
jgi:hypothetical protein